jgi:hypothetical protein
VKTPRARFVRHYLEMVAVMFAGMIVLGIPAEGLLRLAGTSSSQLMDDAPTASFLWMATSMTVPMVWLMRRQGHAWRPCTEMAASMFLPTFAALGVLWSGADTEAGTLMGYEHVAMLLCMLAAMLLRYDEYAGCDHVHDAVAESA